MEDQFVIWYNDLYGTTVSYLPVKEQQILRTVAYNSYVAGVVYARDILSKLIRT